MKYGVICGFVLIGVVMGGLFVLGGVGLGMVRVVVWMVGGWEWGEVRGFRSGWEGVWLGVLWGLLLGVMVFVLGEYEGNIDEGVVEM